MQKIAPAIAPERISSLQTALAAGPASSWYAVYTTSRHEKRVALHFSQREIEHYLPLYRVERKWNNGLKVEVDLPLFPCYIFARISSSARARVLDVPGALAVVGGTGGAPSPLPDAAIEALRWGLRERRIEPHPQLAAGQRVRVLSGAFAGMEGVVLRRKGGCRVVLTLQQIMQSIAVELDETNLEPLTAEDGAPGRMPGLNAICLQGV